MLPKLTIVTPCYNSERFLEATIQSVLEQKYPNLEYIIIDGGSSDGTVDIIRKYEQYLAYWVSESDKGMYDAINKGFARATGEIYAWINSDDVYLSGAFDVMIAAFQKHPEIDWLTGSTTYIDESGETTDAGDLLLYHRDEIENGYYGFCMYCIQQNCCFWRASLWNAIGGIISSMRYAGDYWLWTQFAKHASLVSVNYPVAAFRRHIVQLSQDTAAYRSEVLDCFAGNRMIVALRRFWRKCSRRFDFDIRLLNRLHRREPYIWLDCSNGFVVRSSRKTRVRM